MGAAAPRVDPRVARFDQIDHFIRQSEKVRSRLAPIVIVSAEIADRLQMKSVIEFVKLLTHEPCIIALRKGCKTQLTTVVPSVSAVPILRDAASSTPPNDQKQSTCDHQRDG
jgi:hypothetical protein